MNKRTKILALTAAAFLGTQALAQTSAEQDEAARQDYEAAQQEMESERTRMESRRVDMQIEMRDAEARLEEAARRIGELSSRQLRIVGSNSWNLHTDFNDRPVLGITIGSTENDAAVAGVKILGVSPGGAAAEAGLRSGDVITTINKESLSADNAGEANSKLVDFLSGVEEGDALDVEYLRNGKVLTTEVSPKRMMARRFEFFGPDTDFNFQLPSRAPGSNFRQFVFMTGAGGWGEMEMVELTKDLGGYFGTEDGFLVINAPTDEGFQLRDGDVIQSIDGRTPNSVSHTIRILRSYQSGEKLEIKIMRDKRRKTLKIEVPDNRSSRIEQFIFPQSDMKIHVAPGTTVWHSE